jgi:hypothetical protein
MGGGGAIFDGGLGPRRPTDQEGTIGRGCRKAGRKILNESGEYCYGRGGAYPPSVKHRRTVTLSSLSQSFDQK